MVPIFWKEFRCTGSTTMAQRKIPSEEEVFGNPDPKQQAFHVGCGGEVILICDNAWGCMGCGQVVNNNDIEIVDL